MTTNHILRDLTAVRVFILTNGRRKRTGTSRPDGWLLKWKKEEGKQIIVGETAKNGMSSLAFEVLESSSRSVKARARWAAVEMEEN